MEKYFTNNLNALHERLNVANRDMLKVTNKNIRKLAKKHQNS